MKRKEKRKQTEPCFSLLAVLILSFLIYSCASVPAEKQLFAYLTDKARFVLLPPGGIEKPMDSSQLISASYGGQNFYFNAWVQADENGMDLSLFNEMGASMGELSYKNGAINFTSQVFPKNLSPEYIVADFQLCFYNPIMLKKALEQCGLILEISGSTRRVLNGKTLIVEIEKTQNMVRLVNHLRRYAYTLEGQF